MIRFADNGKGTFYVFNVGGHKNTKHCIDKYVKGKSVGSVVTKTGKVKTGKRYDGKVVVTGRIATCFLDKKLIFTLNLDKPSSK